MPYTDPCDTVIAQLTRSTRANLARGVLSASSGSFTFTLVGFALGRGGYDDTNPVKLDPAGLVDPTGCAAANMVIVDNAFGVGDEVSINSSHFVANVDWTVGASTFESAENLAAAINTVFNVASNRIIFAETAGATITLYSIAPGPIGNAYTLNKNLANTHINLSGGLFTGGANGVAGGLDGSLIDKIYPNALPVINSAAISIFKITSGKHNGPVGATLYDSTKAWTPNYYVDEMITNVNDGSKGLITANTATAITAKMHGGTNNTWAIGNSYLVGIEQPNPTSVSTICRVPRTLGNWGYGEIAVYAQVKTSNIPAEVGTYFMYALGHFPLLSKNTKSVLLFRVITQL